MLLDLDDLDRLWVNAPGPRLDKAELQKRRSNLLEVSRICLLSNQGVTHVTYSPPLRVPGCASTRQHVRASFGRGFLHVALPVCGQTPKLG